MDYKLLLDHPREREYISLSQRLDEEHLNSSLVVALYSAAVLCLGQWLKKLKRYMLYNFLIEITINWSLVFEKLTRAYWKFCNRYQL